MTAAWNQDGVVNTLGSVSPSPSLNLFFSLFFLKAGKKHSNKSTKLLTFWFICYREWKKKPKKSMWSDRTTRTDRRKTFYMHVSIWNRTTSSGLSGDRHLQFPDCIIEMGFLLPLTKKKSMLRSVDIKFSVIWVPQSPPLKNRLLSSPLLTVSTASPSKA